MIKRTLVAILLAAATFATAADPTAQLAGKWQVHINVSDRESDWACTFTQEGSDLGGTCASERGNSEVTGKVDGQKVTWTIKVTTQANGVVTLQYRGALTSPTEMKGFVNVAEYGVEGQFTGFLAK